MHASILHLAEFFLVDGEVEVQVADVVLLHPHHRLVELLVDVAQVAERTRIAQQHLVERAREKGVQQAVVDERQADDAARELEPVNRKYLILN